MLGELEAPFEKEVAVLKITVAALMTTPWIAKFLEVPPGTDLVLLPGLVRGRDQRPPGALRGRRREGPQGPARDPRYFGQAAAAADYGEWDIEILAEINNAPKLPREAIRTAAEYFRASGADVIDIGCTPGVPFPALGDVVRELRASRDAGERRQLRSGRDPHRRSRPARSWSSASTAPTSTSPGSCPASARVVAIPDFGEGLDTLGPTLEALERWGVGYLIDPIIEPIGFGFMASLERYAEVHRRWPEAEQMMGVGNITELTSADTTGVHALLLAICQEVGVRAVLTTEVIPWARGAVREIDIARRLAYYAVRHRALPKNVDDRLVTVKDPAVLEYDEAELRRLHAAVKDSNFRIFADRTTITVFNDALFVRGTDPQAIFAQLGVDEATHAFYLGRELMKAKLAITLGKTYRQEGALAWGYLTPPDDVRSEHVKLTQRRRR